MIIKFATTTLDSTDPNKVTYWFEVKIPTLPWTDICIGFDANGNWTCASRSFFELDTEAQKKAIYEAAELLSKMAVA